MKKSGYLVIFFLVISLVGLIGIQVYWVRSAIKAKEEAFSQSVEQILSAVAQSVEQAEMNKYVERFIKLKSSDSIGALKNSQIRDFVFVQENKNTKETFIYKQGLLEEYYTMPSKFLNLSSDSTYIANYVSKQTSRTFSNASVFGEEKWFVSKPKESVRRFSSFDKAMFEEVFKEVATKLPIIDRLTKSQIELLLSQKLKNQGIDLDFEYAIYDREQLTEIKSEKFNPQTKDLYTELLFETEGIEPRYQLQVDFPKKESYLLSFVYQITFFALLFTIVITWIFINTLLQLRNQKQISEMKTDFINNMTHEFKTPIATIKLALDAMKNPIIMQDSDRLKGYMRVIGDENKRMLAQVENVLQISKLDKNQMEFDKEPIDAHETIENAIVHTQLLLDDKGGEINKYFQAENTDILASELHFTNVLVNILENAIKYSDKAPKIDIYTEELQGNLIIKVKDEGIGMSKSVQKRIFDKFYRENTGDIHNVKGHGLGLAYVKRVVKAHDGRISVESEKGKGSTFIIKIPLIV